MTTYTPKPIDTSDVELSPELLHLTELLAENAHEQWSVGRIAQGYVYGPVRDDEKKHHPCLVPYDALPESEKAFDRATAMETIKVLVKLGYTIEKK